MSLAIPFKRSSICITINERIIGGVPTDPKLIAGWLKANMPDVAEAEREKLAATTLAEVPKVVEEESKAMWTTFKRDAKGLYIEGRQVKAAFKEAANILRDVFQKQEAKDEKAKSRFTALRAKLAERLFIEESKIYLHMINGEGALGDIFQQPTGSEEQPIHVMTAQGPRTALKKFDYCEEVGFTFTVRYLDDGLVTDELITALLEYMGWNGIGAARSQGNGQFHSSVTLLDRAPTPAPEKKAKK